MNKFGLVLLVMLVACGESRNPGLQGSHWNEEELGDAEKLITVLGTNDIHGAMEGGFADNEEGKSQLVGGLVNWAAITEAIRSGLAAKYGEDRAGVFMVDAGDQFQGTLSSNYDEGMTILQIMKQIGYDAIVPGNHDYDFGPLGWEVDIDGVLLDSNTAANPLLAGDRRGALTHVLAETSQQLISANTFLRSSFEDLNTGHVIPPEEISSSGCDVRDSVRIDWGKVRRPSFLESHRMVERAGVRVALVGLDYEATHAVTMGENVSDLCFDDQFESYKRLVVRLLSSEHPPDMFVLTIHDSDIPSKGDTHLSDLVRRLNRWSEETYGKRVVDAVICGHTHRVQHIDVDGVPILQSGRNGQAFGRIDLIWNEDRAEVDVDRTRALAGVVMYSDRCDERASFCSIGSNGSTPEYDGEGLRLPRDGAVEAGWGEGATLSGGPYLAEEVLAKVQAAAAQVSEIRYLPVGYVSTPMEKSWEEESAMANFLADQLLAVGPEDADLAVINTGGVRTTYEVGPLTYNDLVNLLPFANLTRVVELEGKEVVSLMKTAAKGASNIGAIMQSGLVVEIMIKGEERRLESIDTVTGERVYRYDEDTGGEWINDRRFKTVVMSFLYSKTSGIEPFRSLPDNRIVSKNLGVARNLMRDRLNAIYAANLEEVISEYPDFDDKVGAGDLPQEIRERLFRGISFDGAIDGRWSLGLSE